MKIRNFIIGAIQTTCYFLIPDSSSDVIVIDPGMDGEGVLEKLGEKGLKAKYVLLTHGHFDHSMGAQMLREAGAKLAVHAEDVELLGDQQKNGALRYFAPSRLSRPRSRYSPIRRRRDLSRRDIPESRPHSRSHEGLGLLRRRRRALQRRHSFQGRFRQDRSVRRKFSRSLALSCQARRSSGRKKALSRSREFFLSCERKNQHRAFSFKVRMKKAAPVGAFLRRAISI